MLTKKYTFFFSCLASFILAGLFAPKLPANDNISFENNTPFEQYSYSLELIERGEHAEAINLLDQALSGYLDRFGKTDKFYFMIQDTLLTTLLAEQDHSEY